VKVSLDTPKHSIGKRRSALAALAAVFFLLAGCTVGPKYNPPVVQTPVAPNYKESPVNFQNAEGWKVASPQDAMLRGKWWEVFGDPDLNALEEQLEIDNQNIKQYFQQFMEARALIAQARAQYWPTVTVNPAMNWSRTPAGAAVNSTQTNNNGATGSSGSPVSTQGNAGSTGSFLSFPVDVAWEPDFFGKIRNLVREYQSAAQVSAADLEVERLTEETSLAQYYFEIRGQDVLQKILNDTVDADQKALDVTQGLYDTGVDDYISVVEARTTLQSAQAAAINVGVARAQYEHAIAVLLGKLATDFSLPAKPQLIAPPPIPVGVPTQLLERRPDVAAAERTLAKDNSVIGIGYAAYYPTVTLSASGGFESSSFKSWFTWPSRFFSTGPSASETIFNGGLYRAQIHQYVATYNADLAAYRQTILAAFQQVEDYLATVRIYSQEVGRQQDAVKSAQEFLNLELVRYDTGVDPYVDVLSAQTTLLTDQENLTTSQIQEIVGAVDLVDALGGGWDRSELPSPSQVSAKPSATDYQQQK
jgi:NodT family efflux transporter outer membrane factor (OMF) lipoprotein